MVYEKPEARILCFAPVENIAAADWDWSMEEGNGGGFFGSEVDIPIAPSNNPEGDL